MGQWTANLLDVQNKPTLRAKISAQYVHMPLENNGNVLKSTNNALAKFDV